MAVLYKCDGCDEMFGHKIEAVELKLVGEVDFIWRADLCKSCLQSIEKPHNWPREVKEDK